MHYYAQHTATRNWFAPLLTIEEVERAKEAQIPVMIALYLIGEYGFESAADVVGQVLTRAAHHTTTGRGRS